MLPLFFHFVSAFRNSGLLKRGIASEVRAYLKPSIGMFTTRNLYIELNISDYLDKKAARKELERLARKGRIERDKDKTGVYRIMDNKIIKMDLKNVSMEALSLWLPMGLSDLVAIQPGNVILVAGTPNSGKSAFVLNIIKHNVEKWQCHYFNSESSPEELRKRLDLFDDFPLAHPNFNAYERDSNFSDVIFPGRGVLNVIDYLERYDDHYKTAEDIAAIHRKLGGAIAVIAIQTKTGEITPLGGDRSLEKARLAISLKAGNRDEPNVATILKAKNRRTTYGLNRLSRAYHLISGADFSCPMGEWA